MNLLTEALKELHIPFEKQFFNLPFSHYERMVETIGFSKVHLHCRNILLYYKNDIILLEKSKRLMKKLNKLDTHSNSFETCQCGFVIMEEYEFCPCCNTKLYNGKNCFYMNTNHSCSVDQQKCKWKNYDECGKIE